MKLFPFLAPLALAEVTPIDEYEIKFSRGKQRSDDWLSQLSTEHYKPNSWDCDNIQQTVPDQVAQGMLETPE